MRATLGEQRRKKSFACHRDLYLGRCTFFAKFVQRPRSERGQEKYVVTTIVFPPETVNIGADSRE